MTTIQEEIIRLQTAKADIREALIAKGVSVDETESINSYAEKISYMTESGSVQKGDPGASAYEIAVKNGFIGTEVEWLESLKGETGPQGEAGEAGASGTDGTDGLSAYEIAVKNGFSGSETEWLISLKGEKGDTGPQGIQGEAGAQGLQGNPGEKGADGQDGLSAYEIAVNNGFSGTEEEWLASLKGEKGEPGDAGSSSDGITKSEVSSMIDEALNGAILDGVPGESAYDVAVKNGFTGTETEWLASLKGDTGANGIDGEDGADGASAYQIALNNGFSGTEEEWLASLKGEKGETGATGADGENGKDGINGTDGASAYDIAVKNGFVGTETEWLASLKGEKGDPGTSSSSGGGSGAAYITETYNDDSKWYRIWSDGWVEQGGILVTTSASSQLITFPVEMASDLFNVDFHIVKGGSSNNTTNNVRIDARKTTSTSVTLYIQPSDETYTSWIVRGMKKV